MAYVYFTIVCLFFGSNFVMMDRATRWFGPVEVGLARTTSAALLLSLLWLFIERKQRVRWRDLPSIALIGVFANAYPYVLQPALIGGGFGHSFFGMTVAFVPLLTVLVSIPLLGVRPSGRQIVGVLGGLGFVFLLMYDGSLRGLTPLMLALAVSVPLSYAVGNTWMRRTLADADPTPLSVVMLLVSSCTILPVVMSSSLQAQIGVEPPAVREGFGVAVLALGVLGVLGTGVCTWAFVRMVLDRGPLFAGMVTYVVPVIALLWGLADGETITRNQLIAIAGILSMVTLVQAPSKKSAAEPSEEIVGDPLPADA